MQLSGKGLLVPGSWKRRYCVLDGRRLYYYQLNGENQGHLHYRDKTSHYVDLDNYDICEEAKGIKTASNVLVISSSEIEKSFFDTGRLYLSAETAKEMNEWISQIRSAMSALRNGPAKAQPPPKSSSKSAAADVSTCSTAEHSAQLNASPRVTPVTQDEPIRILREKRWGRKTISKQCRAPCAGQMRKRTRPAPVFFFNVNPLPKRTHSSG
ncbi:hypothetical protein DAPPUDRAFT_102446 [Daphnia pulex]|uniref:PH domain-containing protein n=1 Tax=Daphnia pulex TaxID=6669 RepID=E9GGG0_DAPPU|nr:hypothetical protein DAPPUDRAFT_102446 [Daphnia pulex]|eukprot:EFX81397.1 hypothetical protein DAPPUDRAFT_102446 [Daphnia pulex]